MKTQVTWWLTTALVLICFGVLWTFVACTSPNAKPTPGAFVTVWKGVAGEPLKIPIVGNYTVTWYAVDTPNERHTETVSISQEDAHSFTHPYSFTPPRDGEYVDEAGPEGVEYMRMWAQDREGEEYHFGSAKALLRVEQFGKVQWKNMKALFAGCENKAFVQTFDIPDLLKVFDMQ